MSNERASVLFGIGVAGSGCIGTHVFTIDDLILVTVGRASIRLGIVGLDAGGVGTCVVRIGNAVFVTIGRAAVRGGDHPFSTRQIGASVLLVGNAIVVSIGWAAVGLGIVGLDACDIWARVVDIGNPISVTVGNDEGATIALGIVRANAWCIDTGVFAIEDGIPVTMGWGTRVGERRHPYNRSEGAERCRAGRCREPGPAPRPKRTSPVLSWPPKRRASGVVCFSKAAPLSDRMVVPVSSGPISSALSAKRTPKAS